MDVKRYRRKMRKLKVLAKELRYEKEINEREEALGIKKKKPPWSKVLMISMILVCLEIIIYAEVVMWLHYDLSALYALVGVAASLAAAIWAYCEKSKAENTKGGIIYEKAMQETPEAPADNEGEGLG